MNSPKYNRTFHLPWSEGCSSDDKKATSVSSLINSEIIITEKLDGSNCCLERDNCFARTHAGPPTHPSFDVIKAKHARTKHLIPEGYQFFGENLFAQHSIHYNKLPAFFMLFAIRVLNGTDKSGEKAVFWESWDTLRLFADELELEMVPVLFDGKVSSEKELKELTQHLMTQPSICGDTREGVVVRTTGQFVDHEFSNNVMKMVRKDHVQTGDHWSHKEIVKNKLK